MLYNACYYDDFYRTARPWLFYDFFFKFDPKGWKQSKLLKTLHGFTRKV